MASSKSNKLELQKLDEPRAGRLNIQYAPVDGAALTENPPRFCWLPVIESEAKYAVRVSSDKAFADKKTQLFSDIEFNFFTPDVTLKSGTYFWQYAVWSSKEKTPATNWSVAREFEVADELPETPLPRANARDAAAGVSHPRLWLNQTQLDKFKSDVKADSTHCTWDAFFTRSVEPWLKRDVMPEPAGYPNHQRVAPVWRQTYIDCQEVIYAIRHLAIAGKVLDDRDMLDKAKQWLLSVAAWDPHGTTSRSYTDEWAFRINVALAWGYDWLHDQLTEGERAKVRAALLERTRDVADHVMKHANIHLFPYDSHAVRSVSAVLVPACIAMLHEEPEAKEWLDFSVEFLATVYSPWGDSDGGWAEGPHYWMTGIAYFLEAANLLRTYLDIDFYKRPFFQLTGDFPLFTKAPDTRRATFGDDSTMGDLPCLKIGYNLRQLAGVTGKGEYQWYYDEIKRNDPGTEGAFYNYGWWDLNFDELMYQHDYPIVAAADLAPNDKLRWFKGIGWVAIQKDMQNPEKHIQFVMKSSSFGSISHSHGDQNAFCLSAFGEDLAIQSGHYVAFNSSMHQKWRRQTVSKNAILINGVGQYAGKDKAQAMGSSGSISIAEDRGDHVYISGDATPAYKSLNPSVTKAEREVYFVQDKYFIFVDTVDADEEVELEWLLHTNNELHLAKDTFRYTGEKAGFYGQVLWSEAGVPKLSQNTGFEGVDEKDFEGLPVSTCLKLAYPKSTRHRIATLLVPYRLDAPTRLFTFLDDQGYDCDLYVTDENDSTFKVVVPKSFKV